MLRAASIGVFFFTVTPVLISLQWLLGKLGLPGWGFIASRYYRVLAWMLGIRVRIAGERVKERAVLFVSNHISWVDIVTIGSIAPVAFIAKSEVAKWPLVGVTAKIQRTVFVDRKKRHQTADAIAEIVKRLAGGTSMVLFAEGTSSDGNRVLPFRSALLGAVKQIALQGGLAAPVTIQPMAICYTAINGLPMGRQHRPRVAWYGDLDFVPHFRALLGSGAIDAVVTYGDPIAVDGAGDRKAMTKDLEGVVRGILAAALRGPTRPIHAAK
jgi:1-acyl-sn-glycerol-3-phosphate acyltransferase